ncbi:MAG: hypothetical protein GY838_06455 [bacterium]|nr:hypothetical protein [bacterium]
MAWALLAGGCGAERDPAPAAGGERLPGGTVVIALDGDPDTLNPLLRTSTEAGRVISALGDPLLIMAEDLTWQPNIATSWDVAPDGLAVTFHLRPWNWEDGTPLAAADVVASFELFRDPRVASPQRSFFADVTRAVAVDSATVRYEFARAFNDPLARTRHDILPLHMVRDLDPAAAGSWAMNTHPLSSGHFRLAAWEHNRQLILERNPAYTGTPPLLDRVVFRVLGDVETRVLALEAGEVDLVDQIPPTAARRLADGTDIRIVPTGGRQLYYLQWNCRRSAFADAATRRALSLALDRERMIAALVDGYGRPAVSPVAPVMWNHHRDLAVPPMDTREAARLLASVGWADADGDGVLERQGQPLRFEILTRQGDPVREQGAVILRENLRRVGAEVSIRVLELSAGIDLLRAGEFDAYFGLLNLNLYGDPSGYVHSRSTGRMNLGHYANAMIDSLLESALSTRDRTAALPLWQELQEALMEDPPAAYLFHPDILVGVGPRLRDVRPHMLSPFNNLAEWWIPTGQRRYRSNDKGLSRE